MSRPAIIVLGALGVIALAILLGALALRHRPPQPASVEEPDTVASVRPALPDAARRPQAQTPRPDSAITSAAHYRQPAGKDAGTLLDEASLMAKLHELAASDPPLSLKLAKEALARFPNSPQAPEFEWNFVKALANMERYPEAEEAARVMVKKYPGNDFAADVDRHLLNHPPNPP